MVKGEYRVKAARTRKWVCWGPTTHNSSNGIVISIGILEAGSWWTRKRAVICRARFRRIIGYDDTSPFTFVHCVEKVKSYVERNVDLYKVVPYVNLFILRTYVKNRGKGGLGARDTPSKKISFYFYTISYHISWPGLAWLAGDR